MAHKKMRGRGRQRGTSIKQTLKESKRKAVADKKGKRTLAAKQRNEDAAAPAEAEEEVQAPPQAPAPMEVAAPEGPQLTKRERKALALAEQQHRGLYATEERILLVGEGNFSFARALCKSLGSGAGVYATAFDSERTMTKKYADAAEARKEIEEKFGGTALVGVDATHLHSVKEFRGAFRKIVWNFPHSGSGETDVEKNVQEHRALLTSFFKSAAKCLDPDHRGSAIHVALKIGEPYKSWKIVQIAQAAGLELQTAVGFAPSAFPGYAHRRTAGFHERFSKDDSEELAKGAKVYVFTRRKQLAGE